MKVVIILYFLYMYMYMIEYIIVTFLVSTYSLAQEPFDMSANEGAVHINNIIIVTKHRLCHT